MKLIKICVAALACAGAWGAFADAANTLISFSTKADTYADGKTVLDGEWYALVWSSDGNFDGITATCKPVDANDSIVLMAPLAKDGHCPCVVFEVDSKVAHSSGKYEVYLLDTRSTDGKSVAAATADGKPALVNGASVSAAYAATSATEGGASAESSSSAQWAQSAPVANGETVQQPKITAFKVDGARVTISVEDLLPGVKYNVSMGATPDKIETIPLTLQPQLGSDGKAVFNLESPDGKFFRIVREPLTK